MPCCWHWLASLPLPPLHLPATVSRNFGCVGRAMGLRTTARTGGRRFWRNCCNAASAYALLRVPAACRLATYLHSRALAPARDGLRLLARDLYGDVLLACADCVHRALAACGRATVTLVCRNLCSLAALPVRMLSWLLPAPLRFVCGDVGGRWTAHFLPALSWQTISYLFGGVNLLLRHWMGGCFAVYRRPMASKARRTCCALLPLPSSAGAACGVVSGDRRLLFFGWRGYWTTLHLAHAPASRPSAYWRGMPSAAFSGGRHYALPILALLALKTLPPAG